MTSIEVAIKDAVLPAVLANAALLIAAPSLGCLNTYTRALSDLCRAYSLSVPDLTQVLQYRSTSSTSITSVKSNEGQEVTPGSMYLQDLNAKIKGEYVEPELDTVKQEFAEEYKDMYMACRKTPAPYKSHIPVANQNTSVGLEAQPALSLLPDDQQLTKPATPQNTNAVNGILLQENIPGKAHQVLDVPSPASSDKSIKQSKYNMITRASILESDGKVRIYSLEEAKTNRLMPVKRLRNNMDPLYCGMYVITEVEGPASSSFLCITFKEGKRFKIPFTHICEISSWTRNCFIIHYSSQDGQRKTYCIESGATNTSDGKMRSGFENNSAMLNWLQTFLG